MSPKFSFVRSVYAVRGQDNQVDDHHEAVLRSFVSTLSRLKPVEERRPDSKCLTISGRIKDWFLQPNVGDLQWTVDKDEEKIVIGHCAALCALGIPPFFGELQRCLMKLFVPLEVDVRQDFVSTEPGSLTEIFWRQMKSCVVKFALEHMSAVASGPFRRTEHRVAVFDSSGYSPAADRWKISFRIVFFELGVNVSQLLEIREGMIISLNHAWDQLAAQAWKEALTPPHSQDLQRSFWARILDDGGAVYCQKPHSLVFCDTVCEDKIGGKASFYLPEGRPLLPYGLFSISFGTNGRKTVDIKRLDSTRLQPWTWGELGSVSANSAETVSLGGRLKTPERTWTSLIGELA